MSRQASRPPVTGTDDHDGAADVFLQHPPEGMVTADMPRLDGDIDYCAGEIVEGCVEVTFHGPEWDFLFRHEYGTGFELDPDRHPLIEHPNRGKRSVGIDVSTAGGQEVLYEIAKTSMSS